MKLFQSSILTLLLVFLVVLALLNKVSAEEIIPEVYIYEVFANPEGSDSGKEWLELYNNSDLDINISGWELQSISSTGNNRTYILPADQIIKAKDILILKNLEVEVPEYYSHVTIEGLNLYNTNATLKLLNNTELVYEIAYETAPNGKSLELGCELLKTHSESNSLGKINSNFDPSCWSNAFNTKLYFSEDNKTLVTDITSSTPQKFYFGIDNTIKNVKSFEVYDSQGNTLDNPVVLNSSYYGRRLFLEIITEDGNILRGYSNPIYIAPEITLNEYQNSEDRIWIELKNTNDFGISTEYLDVIGNKGSLVDSITESSTCNLNAILNSNEICTLELTATDSNTILFYGEVPLFQLDLLSSSSAISYINEDGGFIETNKPTPGEENELAISIKSILFSSTYFKDVDTFSIDYLDQIKVSYLLSSDVKIISEKLILDDGTEIPNPFELYQYLNEPIYVEIKLENGQIISSESKPINIDVDILDSLIITEVFPSPGDGESEWVELFNTGSEKGNLKNWYFSEELAGDKCDKNESIFGDFSIDTNTHFVVESNLGITLNNSGQSIYLCNPKDQIIDTVDYPPIDKSTSWSRVYLDEYKSNFAQTDSTKNEFNIINQPETVVAQADPQRAIPKTKSSSTIKNSSVVSAPSILGVDNFSYRIPTNKIDYTRNSNSVSHMTKLPVYLFMGAGGLTSFMLLIMIILVETPILNSLRNFKLTLTPEETFTKYFPEKRSNYTETEN